MIHKSIRQQRRQQLRIIAWSPICATNPTPHDQSARDVQVFFSASHFSASRRAAECFLSIRYHHRRARNRARQSAIESETISNIIFWLNKFVFDSRKMWYITCHARLRTQMLTDMYIKIATTSDDAPYHATRRSSTRLTLTIPTLSTTFCENHDTSSTTETTKKSRGKSKNPSHSSPTQSPWPSTQPRNACHRLPEKRKEKEGLS